MSERRICVIKEPNGPQTWLTVCQAEDYIEELQAVLKQTTGQREYAATKRAEQAEAALEEAITYTIKYGPYQGSSRETVWADLRARAEEGRE